MRSVAILGGRGRLGSALARRWAHRYEVLIGSRQPAQARAAAEQLAPTGRTIRGGSYEEVVEAAELVTVAIPYRAHASTLRALAERLSGKLVIDMTVPLAPDQPAVVRLPRGQAAALEAAAILGPSVRVVAAMHNISADHLNDGSDVRAGDVLICGDDPRAKDVVVELIAALGLRGLDAGPLANAIAVESLTPVLIHLNRRYRARGCSVAITGLPAGERGSEEG